MPRQEESLLNSAAGPPQDLARRKAILGALAPAQLLDSVWLARVAQTATAHLPSENRLFELYCRAMGLESPARSPALRFRAALTMVGVDLPLLDDPDFFQHSRIPDCALRLPAFHLSLTHRPRHFFPELLGYTLAHCYRQPAWWDAVPDDGGSFMAEVEALARTALEDYPEKDTQEERIHAGWALYRFAFDALLRDLEIHLARHATAEEAMLGLIRAKRASALGYHQKVLVAGCDLDRWLSRNDGDFRPLLRALTDSGYIDRACPAASSLVRSMEFGGPMFGVFEERERQICLAWIEDPEQRVYSELVQGRRQTEYTRRSPDPFSLDVFQEGAGANIETSEALSKRRLFTALLRSETPAECPAAAEHFIRGILRRTRLFRLLRGARRGFVYSPEAFSRYIEELHRREVERYRPLVGPPRIGREFCRWAALQLAPAILADGAWLAGIATAAEKLGEIGRHLLRIYADELGNGRPERNHPNVYRRLLESLGFSLPPIDSEAFAENPEFLEAAFDIPVYLLAMGLAADRYFPELLGLNLAIELSGLGAGYMQTIDILRYHGIDPAIIRLHLSIDNLASGHAARAREAIVLYLNEIRRREGAESIQNQWQRIWIGYLSLNTVALGLAARFALRFLGDRIPGTR